MRGTGKFVMDIGTSMFVVAITGRWQTKHTATLAVFVGLIIVPASMAIRALFRV